MKLKICFQFVFVIFTILFFDCRLTKFKDEKVINLESYRNLAMQELLSENTAKDCCYEYFYNTKYEIPDSISRSDPRVVYIKQHPELPKFIIKALIEGEPDLLMTIGEFFLCKPEFAKSVIILPNRISFDDLYICYKKDYDEEQMRINSGDIWIFRYGFLWEIAEI